MNVALEPSIGRNYEIGTIRWPRFQQPSNSRLRIALSICTTVRATGNPMPVARNLGFTGGPTREPLIDLLVIAVRRLASMALNANRFCTARNHPLAARFWKHHLAKTASGWVE